MGKTSSAPGPSMELRGFCPIVQIGHQTSREGVGSSKATQSAETMTSILAQCLLGRQAEPTLSRKIWPGQE